MKWIETKVYSVDFLFYHKTIHSKLRPKTSIYYYCFVASMKMSKVYEKDAAAATPETSEGEEKTNLAVPLGSSSSHAQPAPAIPFMPGSVFHANPCDFFLSMAGLLNVWLHDPSIKDIAKQIENDPSFNKMAEQFRQTFHGDGVRQFDVKRQYFLTMEQQVMQNPQLMKMAKSLGTFIMQDPSVSQMLESLSNPAKKEQLEVRMARIKENPSLKPILEEIESGGPTAMMRYWNDEDVLKKVGEALGLAVTEEATACAGHRVADSRKELQQVDEGVKDMKAKLMSLQKQQQLKEEIVKVQKAKLTSIQEKKRQLDMVFEVSRAELMSVLEQYQHNEQSEALKARLMNLREQQQEQQEQQQLINHDIFTLSQIVATAEQEVAADKQRIAPLVQVNAVLEQRLAALEPRFAAKEQATACAGHTVAYIRKKQQQFDEEVKAMKAELMSKQKQQQLKEEEVKAKKARLMKMQELQERGQLVNHDVFTMFQSVATAEQEVAALKQWTAALEPMIAAMEQRIAAMEPMIAAVEQAITMANDHTEPVRARVGVSVAVTIGVFSHVYR
ncbi:hypothetical protein HanIR_Chr10g0477411 [Helianthus annuus]|nr:hypothetical protein HanIR_Chr10g0477411 [Helianthus annuus]